jgi:alcohol dehydrogenase
MRRSLAAVFDGQPGVLELREFATPRPTSGEVVVRVLGCTLCGSDLHSVEGRRRVPVPTVLGHEIVGEIVTMGDAAQCGDLSGAVLSIGDRVTWAIVASCGHCFYCERGLSQKCLNAVKYGHEPLRPGRELLGGLASHCLLVPGTAIMRLPNEMPLEVACPASCATATIAAAIESLGKLRDRTVLVLGAGMLGLTACAMAQAAGAMTVIAADIDANRRTSALAFGATHAVAPESLSELVPQLTSGHGVDAALECSGATSAFEAALPLMRLGGTIALIGSVFPSAPVPLALEQVVRRNLTLHGIHNYQPAHLRTAVQFLATHHGRFPFASLVSEWLPLSEVRTAFARARESGSIRLGIQP